MRIPKDRDGVISAFDQAEVNAFNAMVDGLAELESMVGHFT